MFKNMKLATKMGLGFGALVVIAATLSFVGWYGLSNVTGNVELANESQQNLTYLLNCATLRQQFAAEGFSENNEGRMVTDRWQEQFDLLRNGLNNLQNRRGLSYQQQGMVRNAIERLQPYVNAFNDQADAQRMCDEAFSTWSEIGWSVTEELENMLNTTIRPAMQSARQENNI